MRERYTSRTPARCMAHGRRRRPCGVAVKPPASRAAPSAEPEASTERAVGLLHREASEHAAAYGGGERRGRGSQHVGLVGPGEQRAAAALDVEHERAVDEHHQRARLAAGPVPARDLAGLRGPAAAPRRTGWPGRSRRARAPPAAARGRGGQAPRRARGRSRRAARTARRRAPRRRSRGGSARRPRTPRARGRRRRSRPGMRSAATAPRVTTPCRSSRLSATAAARSVGSLARAGSSDQRPATVGGPERLGSPSRGRA